MHESFQRILTGAIFFLLTIAIAIFGYVLFGWELIDAIYMVIITIFGVGYGEVQPLETPAEKLFTIGVIVAGTSSAVYIVGGFVQMVTEGEINRAFESRRKTQGIERLERHSIVCGFGRMGEILAKKLHEARKPFAIVDNDPDRMALAESLGYLVRLGSAADEEVLKSVGIDRAKCLATVLSDDALNVFITLTARELNPNLTILARGELPSTGKKLQLAGADRIVLPAEIGALQMSNYITHPTVFEFLEQEEGRSTLNDLLSQINLQFTELAIGKNSLLRGRTIGELEVRGKGIFLVVALRRPNGEIFTHPPQSEMLDAGDTVMVMGHAGDIPQFARRHEVKHELRYRGAKLP
ncbi:potassium channel family protein [Baaleninema simplex]|uniref:potassium channel family protein n=1 Tax=Baaleninema simplex TaxID=2862350 RepID=UPI0003449D59|nr:potassium channel protein [Baaleninema simplex]